MTRHKLVLLEQPVPKALGPKTQALRPGRAAATFPPPGPLGLPDPAATPHSQLEQWLTLLVGEENAECAVAILEALLLLAEDVARLAVSLEDGVGGDDVLPTIQLITDLVTVALTLPPKCMDDESTAATLLKIYEIFELARGAQAPAAPPQKITLGGGDVGEPSAEWPKIDPMASGPQPFGRPKPASAPGPVEIHQRIIELIREIPDMEILDEHPGLGEQIADKLMDVTATQDLDTQADIIVTLLPNKALRELDSALNKKAYDLPGAGFIQTLNDYDNKLGLNIIPDDIVNGPAVDLLISATGVVGILSPDDIDLLLNLSAVLREKVSNALNWTPLDRIKSFVKIVSSPDIPRIETPRAETPVHERKQLQEQRYYARWKVIAGIR